VESAALKKKSVV